jgi:uncharacterized protein
MTTAHAPAAETDEAEQIRAAAGRVAAAGQSSPRHGRDRVNLAMIRNWIEAIGDPSPVYSDTEFAAESVHGTLVAPPAMIQVWTMPGLHRGLPHSGLPPSGLPHGGSPPSGLPHGGSPPGGSPRGGRPDDDPLGQMSDVLEAAGYTSIVATNCDQAYHRYLRVGEQVSVRASLVDVTGPKRTALGPGWFVTTRSTWYAGDEAVATMDFRILRFRPPAAAPAAPPSPVMRPLVSPDTEFFWAGTAAGELRIQRCEDCAALRHPPGPMCPQCGSARPGYVIAAGTGEVYSYVVHHHPAVPGKQLPMVVALVQLPEGVRMVGELLGVSPDRVRIGLPVQVEFVRVDDQMALPAWREAGPQPAGHGSAERVAERVAGHRPADGQPADGQPAAGQPADRDPGAVTGPALPELVIDVTPTFVVASAIATRDFQDVHHDRDRAVASGNKDIFLNILTTTGLVERFVSGWAGPRAVFRAISIRLGVPCYAGDTLTFSGQVTEEDGSTRVVAVTGRCRLGPHVTGTVRVDIPAMP